MKLKKNKKSGVSFLFLLLLLTSSISFITFSPKNNNINQNSIFLSAPEDNYEPNNFPSLATDISFNEANWLSAINGNGTLLDDDWYLIDLDPGEERLKVDLIFNHAAGNIDIEVYDGTYSLITGSSSMDDNEFLELDLFPSGIYYLRIFGAYAGNTYDFYREDLMPLMEDDWMEDNDEFWSAWWIDPNEYHDLRIVEYDEDWFRFYLNYDDFVEVHIYFNDFDGNLELELYDPSNNFEDGSYTSYGDQFISFTADESGDWRIRIYRVSGDSSIQVNNNLELKVNGMMGGDDPYEKNDIFYDAYNLHDDEYTWLSDIKGPAVQGDEDWYRIHVTPGFQHLIINLMFEGNINADIYKRIDEHTIEWRDGNHTMVGDHHIDINYTEVFGIKPGIYFIQVTGDNSEMEYDLWWDDLQTDTRDDDNYEENDDLLSAYDLSSHQYEELWRIDGSAIQRDNDWYKIKVDTGFEHLFVNVTYDYQEGAIGIEIYDEDFSKVTGNFTYEDHELISYDLPSNGTYYIRIHGDHSGNIYSLKWKTREPYIEDMIPGYDIFILLVTLFGVATIIVIKNKRRKYSYK